MNEKAAAFLADLDCLYWRHHHNQWKDYCLECCVPNSSVANPVVRIPLAGAPFHPNLVITQLLVDHGISLEEFLTAWIRVHEPDGEGDAETLAKEMLDQDGLGGDWTRGHLPWGCPRREGLVKALELL